MSKVASLNRAQPKAAPTFFSRHELQQLLNLYAQQVANGAWRDYAIDQGNGTVVFSVFRHTMEQPLYAVAVIAHPTLADAMLQVLVGRSRH